VSIQYCIQCTLPESHCPCDQAPNFQHLSQLAILFHPREVERRNSTGRILKNCCKLQSATWHRLKSEQLSNQFKQFALIYPGNEQLDQTRDATKMSNIEGFLLIDATWQESKKMLRQSEWLSKLPKFTISGKTSQYKLRRNQISDGLSTIECATQWLASQKLDIESQQLDRFFRYFQTQYLTAREAGLLK